MNVRKTGLNVDTVDVCKISLWQEEARSGAYVTAVPLVLSLSLFYCLSNSHSFHPLLLIPSSLVSFPFFLLSIDLPCGCPMTLSRRRV